MKKYIIIAVLIAVAAIIWWIVSSGGSVNPISKSGILSNKADITIFMDGDTPSGNALIRLPYQSTPEADQFISIWLDGNSDGSFSDDEQVIDNYLVDPKDGKINGFYFDASVLGFGFENRNSVLAKVSLLPSQEDVQVEANITKIDAGSLFDLASVENPDVATKGWGIQTAYAQQAIPKGKDADAPDFNQRPGECGPTSAANSLINLINQYGDESQLPPDLDTMLQELKQDMNWSPNDGTPPDLFVQGKNAWAARHGLPIRTEKIGDQNGLTTLQAVSAAIAEGKAVEMRIVFADADTHQAVGGHMLTVTGIQPLGNRTFLEVNDPVTPQGTETLAVSQNQVLNYGPWNKGVVVLSWAFSQEWEGSPTGTALDTMTAEEIQGIRQAVGDRNSIKVILYQNNHIPISLLHIGKKEEPGPNWEGCPLDHWHAQGTVESLEGNKFTDPKPTGCGFGTLIEKPVLEFFLELKVSGLENLK